MDTKDPKPPTITNTSGRPLTSRTRRKLEQIEDDENLALVLALEEDEKIAAKLQRDLQNGIEVNEYHRLNTAGRKVGAEEFGNPESFGFDDAHFNENEDGIIFTNNHDAITPDISAKTEPDAADTKSKYDVQRATLNSRQKLRFQVENVDSDSEPIDFSNLSKKPVHSQRPPSAGRRSAEERVKPESRYSVSPNFENHVISSPPQNSDDLSADLKKIIAMISEFSPEHVEAEYKLQPFIPDYIPSIGDIDPMIKIPIPKTLNGILLTENLLAIKAIGVTLLDEPGGIQSDPAVIDLAIRSIALANAPKETKVRTIKIPVLGNPERTQTAHKMIQKWSDTVTELNAKKKQTKSGMTFKDLENLMAEWPSEIDEMYSQLEGNFSIADMDLGLKEKVALCCSILDIPVRTSGRKSNQNESLVSACANLFALYSEFKNSQHFGHKDSEKTK